jgi:hypothetical protein
LVIRRLVRLALDTLECARIILETIISEIPLHGLNLEFLISHIIGTTWPQFRWCEHGNILALDITTCKAFKKKGLVTVSEVIDDAMDFYHVLFLEQGVLPRRLDSHGVRGLDAPIENRFLHILDGCVRNTTLIQFGNFGDAIGAQSVRHLYEEGSLQSYFIFKHFF